MLLSSVGQKPLSELPNVNQSLSYDNILQAMDGLEGVDMFLDMSTFDVLHSNKYAATAITLYTFVIVFGVIGNALVVLTLIFNQQATTATDVFIGSLAIVDIAVSFSFMVEITLMYRSRCSAPFFILVMLCLTFSIA